ncbi:acyl-coenzyme A oxidase 1-like [Epargyreus clarus]|uniref:acyl-coenzyme A oxidase 1-like n=1 Tax=Epargyreus clarus TaxID=520877 RepID=UPI003C2EB383
MTAVNDDLVKERAKCDFDIEELTREIDGGEELTIARRKMENKILKAKELKDDVPIEYLSHKEKCESHIRKTCIIMELTREHIMENPEYINYMYVPSRVFRVHSAVLKDANPVLGHFGMFLPNIQKHATPEQQAEWLKIGWQTIGTYAQSELGHGSNIKSLETTATYDPETEEFILNSPTLTAYKWWPSGLGILANHCMLVAQLFIKGVCYGNHFFYVKIRDLDTHMPCPGVKLGDIGPKAGLHAWNNGFLGFDNHRIPRNNMLMKFTQVLKDGTYVKAKSIHDKIMFSNMTFVRAMILSDIAYELAKAATIAIRYSAVRRQSQIKPDEPEVQILDYVTQQHKLFIALATSHAYRVVGLWLWNTHNEISEHIDSGNLRQLPELHATVCGLKAISTRQGTACVELCRLACGGHGYMMSSNLPNIYALTIGPVTYDGEYTVLLLQTARYLMKTYKEVNEGTVTKSTISYLEKYLNKNNELKWKNTPNGIIEGFQAVAVGKIKAAYESIDKYLKLGKSYEEASNLSSVKLASASEAHARAVMCDIYWRETQIKLMTVSATVGTVLQQLAELYLTYWALETRGDFLLYTNISYQDIEQLEERYERLLALIRPNAVGIVDAFDFSDEILGSTLGAYDGRVYERLMEEAMKSPINAEPVNQTFHKYIKPMFLKNKL